MNKSISVILVAAGKGARMGHSIPKQFLSLKGKPIVTYSLDLFKKLPHIQEIFIVCDPKYQSFFPKDPQYRFVKGGERRQDSVWNALKKVSPLSDLVCIHDAARPLLSEDDALRVIDEASRHKAAALAVPVKCTIKETRDEDFVHATCDRSHLWEIQTPQVIEPHLLKEGFHLANEKNLTVTDDVSLVELLGHPVKLVKGSYSNMKLTTHEDLPIMEALLDHAQV